MARCLLLPAVVPILACAGLARPQNASTNAAPAFRLAGTPVPVGPMAATPALGDFDLDGDLDVAIACGPCCGREACEESGHVQILLNDGAGALALAGERIRIGATALGVAVGDVNGDGRPDVVAHHHGSYDVAVLLGDGRGGFGGPAYFPLHRGATPHVHSVALADANGDGRLDIFATMPDDYSMSVLLGDGEGGFRPALGQPFFAQRHPYSQLRTLDINSDGHTDAIMTDLRGNGLTVLVGDGAGMFSLLDGFSFQHRAPIRSAERPTACALGDIDGDGDADAIVFIDESATAVRMINEGAGLFAEPHDATIDLGAPAIGGELADVTGDGVPDIVATTTMTEMVAVCAGRGDGTFSPAILVPAGGVSPHVAVGDMNGDGRLDIVTGNYDSGSVSVLLRAPH